MAAPDCRDPGQTHTLQPGPKLRLQPGTHASAWYTTPASTLQPGTQSEHAAQHPAFWCPNPDWHPAAWDSDQPRTLQLATQNRLAPCMEASCSLVPKDSPHPAACTKTCLHPAQIALALHSLAPAPSPIPACPSSRAQVFAVGRSVALGKGCGCAWHSSGMRCTTAPPGYIQVTDVCTPGLGASHRAAAPHLYPAPTNSALQ